MQPIIHPKHLGMTLLEIMVVVAILSIVATIAIPGYTSYIQKAKEGECFNEAAAIQLAEEEFFLNSGTYFLGADVGAGANTINSKSDGLYQPSSKTLDAGARNCKYDVILCKDAEDNDVALTACYNVTATGVNDLDGAGEVVSIKGP